MSEPIRATTQYGDMRGTIALDGWNGLATISIAGSKKGYWPIGIELSGEARGPNSTIDPKVYLLLVDESTLEKPGPDGVAQYARDHREIPVFRYKTKMTLSKLLSRAKLKRLSIVLQDKCTGRAAIVLAGGDSIYQDDEPEPPPEDEVTDEGDDNA